QLARMTVQAGIAPGIHMRVLAERPDDSAALVTPEGDLGSADSGAAPPALAATCGVLTPDHELGKPEALAIISAPRRRGRPRPGALRFAKDKLYQRTEFARAGFPVPPFADAPDRASIEVFAAQHGWPVVAKAQRGGYDGRGVWVLENARAAANLMRE